MSVVSNIKLVIEDMRFFIQARKFLQDQIVLFTSINLFVGTISVAPNLEIYLIQSVFNVRNNLKYVVHHFGHIRNDIYGPMKNIHGRNQVMNFKLAFSEQNLCTPILKCT